MASHQDVPSHHETADEYGRREKCFYNHRRAPFRFKDSVRFIQKTSKSARSDELIHQDGLVDMPLPYSETCLDSEQLDPPPSGRYLISNQDELPSNLWHLPFHLKGLHLPKETLDLGFDITQEIRQYTLDIHLKRNCTLASVWLPLCSTDVEKDEGLAFPSSSSRWQSLALRELESEAIDVSEEAKRLAREEELVNSLTHMRGLTNDDLSFQKLSITYPEPISPPLSPMSDASSQHHQHGSIVEIPIIDLTSEPSSPPNSVVDRLQESTQNGCLDSEPDFPSTDPSSPPPIGAHAFLDTGNPRTSDLKVDVPMVDSSSPVSEGANRLLLSDLGVSNNDDLASEPIDLDNFFDEAITDILKERQYRANQMVGEEQMNPRDSLMRMAVPKLDFDIPPPESDSYLTDPEAHFAWLQKTSSTTFHLPPCGSLSQLSSSLKWTPVPHGTGRVSSNEDIGPLAAASRIFLALETPQLGSDYYIAKQTSLRILNVVEDDESDEERPHSTPQNLPSPEGVSLEQGTSGAFGPQDVPGSLLSTGLSGLNRPIRRKAIEDPLTLLPSLADSSATSKLLSSYIELRNPKKAKVSIELTSQKKVNTMQTERPSQPAQDALKDQPLTAHTDQKLEKAYVPELSIPQGRCRFVVSLDISRTILSHLEKTWPGLELIDRDYTKYNTVTWSPGSAQRQQVVSELSYEADIAVSPSVGIIITTLLKVKQKPLPGSTTPTPLRDRIQRVSDKVENLSVVVSEANPAGEYVGAPTASDLAAYADFVRFTLSLEAGIMVYFVPGANETAAKWALSLMCRFAPQSSSFAHFLHSRDTSWDMFFRRAGMNVFAAQVLSGLLYSEHGNLGLVRFLAMTTEGRVSKYGQIMGGERVLRRVCELLDRRWM